MTRPRVFVLTDGSGHSGKSRLHRTDHILSSLGALPGSIYGRLTDAEIYAAILNGEIGLFTGLVDELAEFLVRDQIQYIVGDAIEGYNPAHDVCRLVINAAVEKAAQLGNQVANFDVLLVNQPSDYPQETMIGHVSIAMSENMLAQKVQASLEYIELEADVNEVLEEEGRDAIRTECLRRVTKDSYAAVFDQPPYYELYGEQQVGVGYYRDVIRYRDHVLPIAVGLAQFVDDKGLASCANSDY